MARILIFTAKWPFSSREIDGGSITVSQYVSVLAKSNEIDYLYLKKSKEEITCNVPEIHHLEVVDGEYLDYHTYNAFNSNKFLIRLENIPYNNRLIKERIDKYDLVIIVHCLQAMGLEKILTTDQLQKIVVFPMFLADSYIKSGDVVPKEYIAAEKSILNKVGAIITPSVKEKDYIVNNYCSDSAKIFVIPRAVGLEFVGTPRKLHNKTIELCYIASFKNQKNNLDAIRVVKCLYDAKIKVRLHLVGTHQDASVFQSCLDYIAMNDMSEQVVMHDIMPQIELVEFYKKMDFNISTSLCETFGRSIFEGLAMGLPTLVYDCLDEVVYLTKRDPGIVFVSNYTEMANAIKEIIIQMKYEELSKQAIKIGQRFSFASQERAIVLAIHKILNKE